MKYLAMIRHPGGVVRTHKVRLRGEGVFKTRIGTKKTVFAWDKARAIVHERKKMGRPGFVMRYMSFYDAETPMVPLNPPFDGGDMLPDTDQTRALKHAAEYIESRAIEALGKPPAEMLVVLLFMLGSALGTGVLVYFAMRGQR